MNTAGFEEQALLAENLAHLTASEIDSDIYRNHGPAIFDQFKGIDPEALQHYFDALDQYRLVRLGEGGSWELAVRFMNLAAEVDPQFAAAHLDLANEYLNRNQGQMSYAEAAPLAREALDRVVALTPDDPDLPQQLGQFYLNLEWDYARAEEEFEQCLLEDPDAPWCYFFLALIDLREGRHRAARSKLSTAAGLSLGDEQPVLLESIAWQLGAIGDHQRSLDFSREALELVGDGRERVFALQLQAASLIQSGQVEPARNLIEQAWDLDNRSRADFYVYLFAAVGQEAKAWKIQASFPAKPVDSGWLAAGYLALGEIERAYESIQAGIEDHNSFQKINLRNPALFGDIASEPRFTELLALQESMIIHTSEYDPGEPSK